MVAASSLRAIGALSALLTLFQHVSGLSLSISADGGNASSPLLYGFMFEEINYSGDGGLYSQMLRNNGFQDPSAELDPWAVIGDVSISIDRDNPLTEAIPRTLRLDVPANATGEVGVSNSGYWGITVDGNPCQAVVWVKGGYVGALTVSLVGGSSGIEYGVGRVEVEGSEEEFVPVTVDLDTSRAPDGDVVFELTVDGEATAGGSVFLGLPQLYPTTYKGRANGLKPGLAKALEGVQGSFLRFPGGNNLEGADEGTRWKWNETIGPVEDRPGRPGTWGYYNTDGLGLDEYFYWCEDLGLAPVLGVWAGFALEEGGNTPFTGDALTPYVDDVLNELEYILGAPNTTYGAQRAANGHPPPWPLTMVEIGNEDNLGGGCDTYPERFTTFFDAIHAAYPDLTIIASTADPACLPDPLPEGAWLDFHNYNVPENYIDQFSYFDNLDRAHPYFLGEYARWDVKWSDMQGAVSEAVYMIGLERNSDLVKMAAFAPLLQLVGHTQWTPDLIPFTQSPDGITETTSYYIQQLFSVNRGDTVKPVTSDADFGPVYWVASSRADGTYFAKLANFGAEVQEVSISTPGLTGGTLSIVGNDDPAAANTDAETVVTPVVEEVEASEGVFTFTLPAWSVGVLAAR